MSRKRRYHYAHSPPPPPAVIYKEYHELLYGFRCVVTVVDQKICNSTYECDTVKDYEAVYGKGPSIYYVGKELGGWV